jgi:hypothetical protein
MKNDDLIKRLIHIRTALKSGKQDEALRSVRALLKSLDPGQKIEMEMRGAADAKDVR